MRRLWPRSGPGLMALALLAGAGLPAAGQEAAGQEAAGQEAAAPGKPASPAVALQTPILTIDQDRLFDGTLWGQRVARRIADASAALAAENRRIEAELTAEEKGLTDKRGTLPAEDFRKLADDFDARVTEFRRTQDGKARDVARLHDAERQAFFKAALPVMAEVLRDHGAIAVLDNRAIFLAADAIDATEEMIRRIDAELGAGTDVALPPAPDEGAPGGAGTGGSAPAVSPGN